MFRSPKFRLAVTAAVSAALALYIFKRIGLEPVLLAAAPIGWRGFGILCLYQLGLFALLGTAWYVLIPDSYHPRVPDLIWARMVRDATSELLPFSHLGGIVLGARTAVSRGLSEPVAYGSIVIDVTAEMLAQIVFTAAGVVILSAGSPNDGLALSLSSGALVGLMMIIVSCVALAALQRYGRPLTIRLISRFFPHALAMTDSLVHCIQAIYRRRVKVGLSILLHCGGWMASALSTWIALLLMGVRANAWQVLAIESLVCAVRSVAFLVPNGLGVQEVAYAAIAPMFGIGAELGLAISLLKRARDIAVGLPILLLWQVFGARRFLQTSRGAAV